MVHPEDNLPSQRSSRDHVDEGYSTPRQPSFVVAPIERRGSSDHMQPSLPSPGEIRSMFGIADICEYPEYQRSALTFQDPTEWTEDSHLDDLEEKIQKIKQWSDITTSQPPSFRQISRRNTSHQLFRNGEPNGNIINRSDISIENSNYSNKMIEDCFLQVNASERSSGCSEARALRSCSGEVDGERNSTSQTLIQNQVHQELSGDMNPDCNTKNNSNSQLNVEENNITCDVQLMEYLLENKDLKNEAGYQKTVENVRKTSSIGKLCSIVQSLRRVYEDNKKACHVVKKLLEIFNLNDNINGKLEGDTKTILKDKFCRFLENFEPELDTYKDVNKLFELLESGLTADEESTLQSTLENLCVKLDPDLNCLQYNAVSSSVAPSEKEVLSFEKDEMLIKLHNLSSDLSVTILEEVNGKTNVFGTSQAKKDGVIEYVAKRKKSIQSPPSRLSKESFNSKDNALNRSQVSLRSKESNTSNIYKQNMVLPRKNFCSYKEELFEKAIALGFVKDVEELENSSVFLSRRSQLALLERKVNGKYKSMQIAEERRRQGAPERTKPLIRKKLTKISRTSLETLNGNVVSKQENGLEKKPSAMITENKSFIIQHSSNDSTHQKIILDILPLSRQKRNDADLETLERLEIEGLEVNEKDSDATIPKIDTGLRQTSSAKCAVEDNHKIRGSHSEPISSQSDRLERTHEENSVQKPSSTGRVSREKRGFHFLSTLFFVLFVASIFYVTYLHGSVEHAWITYYSHFEKIQEVIHHNSQELVKKCCEYL